MSKRRIVVSSQTITRTDVLTKDSTISQSRTSFSQRPKSRQGEPTLLKLSGIDGLRSPFLRMLIFKYTLIYSTFRLNFAVNFCDYFVKPTRVNQGCKCKLLQST